MKLFSAHAETIIISCEHPKHADSVSCTCKYLANPKHCRPECLFVLWVECSRKMHFSAHNKDITLSLSILRRSKQLLTSHVAEVRRSSNRNYSCFKQEHGLTSTSTLAYTPLLLKVKIVPSQSSNSMFCSFFYVPWLHIHHVGVDHWQLLLCMFNLLIVKSSNI